MDEIQIAGIKIRDILQHPGDYPEEIVVVALQQTKDVLSNLSECKKRLEGNLIARMEEDDATNIVFKDINGNDRRAVLKSGKVDCSVKDADIKYSEKGFDPKEIGEWIFKPSWTKAKEAKKLGGLKKAIIEKLFKEGPKGVTIK